MLIATSSERISTASVLPPTYPLVSPTTAPMTVEIEVFSPHSTAAPVNGERRRLTRYPDAEDTSEASMLTRSGGPMPGWRFVRASDPPFFAAAGLWIDGRPTTPGLAMRLRVQIANLDVFMKLSPVKYCLIFLAHSDRKSL